MKKHLPNFFTLLNLVSGSIGIILVLRGNIIAGGLLIRVGACFDFLDGFLARFLHAYSPLGKQLDSLADLITFGLLPSVIMYSLLEANSNSVFLPHLSLLIVICAALRLARFNLDFAQNNIFLGLSTTAYGIFISVLPYIIARNMHPVITNTLKNPYTLSGLIILGSSLLVTDIPYMAFKFKDYNWQTNKLKYIFLSIATSCSIIWRVEGIAFSMLLYITLGWFLQKKIL